MQLEAFLRFFRCVGVKSSALSTVRSCVLVIASEACWWLVRIHRQLQIIWTLLVNNKHEYVKDNLIANCWCAASKIFNIELLPATYVPSPVTSASSDVFMEFSFPQSLINEVEEVSAIFCVMTTLLVVFAVGIPVTSVNVLDCLWSRNSFHLGCFMEESRQRDIQGVIVGAAERYSCLPRSSRGASLRLVFLLSRVKTIQITPEGFFRLLHNRIEVHTDHSDVLGSFLRVVKFFRKLSDNSEKLLMLPGDCESFVLYSV
ncbi:hypothetical protein PIB30_005884 [Stylosanthes scabra]|uniref:Uncharacterized protein n=1 Tax=Stylosanthes scabra TaxID=79078 RepID=A0ABU6Q444_9FABA|nr:hypothetical protein [Stylosanthes scabra]